jgi:hypothetical protein
MHPRPRPRSSLAPLLLAALGPAAAGCAQQSLALGFGPVPAGATGERVASGGDMDGDGVRDFLVASPWATNGSVHVVSGATGSVRTVANLGAVDVMIGTGDMNLDGRADFVVEVSNLLRAYSGATLAQLWQTPVPYALAAALDDRDGDGRADLAAIAPTNPPELRVLRGLDGNVLAQLPINNVGHTLVTLGDVTGDGVPELAQGWAGGPIEVLRLQAPALLLAIGNGTGGRVLGAANVAGDARNELLAGDSNYVRALNATTGAILRSYAEVDGGRFAVLGDVNGDGFAELAVRRASSVLPSDVCAFVSGATGATLAEWPGTPLLRPNQLASAGDVDGDGFGDIVLGDASANATGPASNPTGGWQVVSGKILATRSSRPTNCYQGVFPPQLGVTRPVLGQLATVAGVDAPANAGGFVAFSLRPAFPTNLGIAGCDAWFDLGAGSLLAITTTATWQATFAVPAAPQLAGVGIALQAFYAPSTTPLGLDLSNGVWATLGY